MPHLLVGLRNEAGDAAVSVQKLLKQLVTDDELLGLSQGVLSRVFPVDQQTLEHLSTGSTGREGEHACQGTHTHQLTAKTFPLQIVTFQRTGLSCMMGSTMSSSTLKVLMTELILNATLNCWHQLRIL